MNTRERKKGQIAIMLAMSFTLLLLLVAMVVNISFLVTAKINLQNATDLAAYAGAAQQARYLTEIGKWNYEMRRNYKAMVFDYLIAYNAERNDTAFYNYINNISTTGTEHDMDPVVCATLQRHTSSFNPGEEERTCNTIPYDQFQTAIDQAQLAALQSGLAAISACASTDPSACSIWSNQFNNVTQNYYGIVDTSQGYTSKYKNYADTQNNYNLRLMGWTLHAYRQMQARIRGIHYGRLLLKDRLNYDNVAGDSSITVFLNSPMSVAAKVINGYGNTGTQTPLQAQGLIDLGAQTGTDLPIKNPMHNAAYTTFKNNLLKVLSTTKIKLFHIVPTAPASGGFDAKDMASGCNGATPGCNEYNGSYLRLQQHDVNFALNYMKIENPTSGGGRIKLGQKIIRRFPVGVLKDNRVWTYYAVVGVADTSQIPFKIFFGDPGPSKAPPLIAVAAARPFGSRIGPYINGNCSDMLKANPECEKNGRDPLYTKDNPVLSPNFSILTGPDTKHLGVKLTVDKTEYQIPTTGAMSQVSNNPNKKVDLFAKTYGSNSRARYYTRQGNFKRDDGFDVDSTESDFYENTNVPPQGNRNSIFAWNGSLTATPPNGTQDEKDDFEAYLKIAANSKSIHKFPQDSTRKYGGNSDYSVYVFRYPTQKNNGNEWTIDALTATTYYPSAMEKAFANTMAVNEFEIKRYIIPYSPLATDFLNYVANNNNKTAYIYAGEANRAVEPRTNPVKQFADDTGGSSYAKMETPDVLASSGMFPESYTAWRIGTRGYRVKLVNIQDLLKANNSAITNPLPPSITIPDLNITIDLNKINY